MEEVDEIIKEFLIESYENLDRLDRDLVKLETAPNDGERLSSVFRTIHTIKGTSGFLSFPHLEHVAHVGENLLVPLRDGKLRLNEPITNGLLSMVDAIRGILGRIENTGQEGDGDYESLLKNLECLREGGGVTEQAAQAVKETEAAASLAAVTHDLEAVLTSPPPPCVTPKSKSEAMASVEANSSCLTESVAHTFAQDPPQFESSVGHPVADSNENSDIELLERSASVADSTIRIEVELLDRLMNLVGELVLARNQVLQIGRAYENPALIAASQRLNHITTELQTDVMKTRMQPISNAWNKLPRIVRDLAAQCGKRVQIKFEGKETELDKTILEAIKDPLTHMVRNSVDHGIEFPDVRIKRGKPPEGTLTLKAFHKGGQVILEICDDGGGIDMDRVRAKAISKGLASEEHLNSMSERELIQLILLPGFSTAEKITNVSGRGVGMDVVKTNIEQIGGTLDMLSIAQKGMIIRVMIPLTLAIIPALTITCKNQRYAIPQVGLLELVRLERERAQHEIKFIHNSPFYRLRGELLPVVYLDEELGFRTPREYSVQTPCESISMVVLQAEDQRFGLIVDQICDTQEIVVKPLSRYLKSISAFSGATIMGDGTVALILDVMGLAQRGNILGSNRKTHVAEPSLPSNPNNSPRKSWLLVDPGDNSQAGIPLESVSRLEEIELQKIEFDGRQEVVQYRGQIMPLIRLTHGATDSSSGSNRLPVVVCNESGQNFGMIVNSVVDIVECPFAAETDQSAFVVAGRVTWAIDPQTYLASFRRAGICRESRSAS